MHTPPIVAAFLTIAFIVFLFRRDMIGLFLPIALLIATFWKSRRELLRNFQFGRFRLGFLMAVIAYKLDRGSFQEHQCNLVCFVPRRIGLSAA